MGIHSVANLGPGAYNPKSEFGKSSNWSELIEYFKIDSNAIIEEVISK